MPEKCECKVVQTCTEKDHSINRRSHYPACFTVQHVGDCARGAEYRGMLEKLAEQCQLQIDWFANMALAPESVQAKVIADTPEFMVEYLVGLETKLAAARRVLAKEE